MGRRAQGTIEYLVIIAVVVVVSLIVVGILSSQTNSVASVSSTSAKISQSSSLISVSGAVVDSDRNGLFIFTNNTGGSITLTRISVEGTDNNYSNTEMPQGDKKTFLLSDVGTKCVCTTAGAKKTCPVTVYYTSDSGLSKDYTVNVSVDCVADVTPNTQSLVAPVCTTTCLTLGYTCGTWTICGLSASCGTCSTGYGCNGSGQCVCTDTCNSLGYQCGTQTVCGSSTNCGSCSSGYACNGSGQCVCSDTCNSLGYQCGTQTVCGSSTNCGTCSSGYSCNGSGHCISNQSYILRLLPTANGDTMQFTVGPVAYPASVNSNDGPTSYRTSSVAGDIDLYHLTDVNGQIANSTINSVTVYDYTSYAGPNSSVDFNIGVKTNGSTYWSGKKTTSTVMGTFAVFSNLWVTNPNTSAAWTWSDINALQAGLRNAGNNPGGLFVTYTYVDVNYTPN